MSTHILSEGAIEELHKAWGFLDQPEHRAPRAPEGTGRTRKTDAVVTLEEIAQILGVTREAVRQIENRALRKCRAWAEANGYPVEDLLDIGTRH